MRIAVIYDRMYPWLNGGGEKTLWDIALELKKLGHEVHYFGTKLWEGPDCIVSDGVILHGVCDASAFYSAEGKRTFWQPLRFGLGLFRALWRERRTSFDLINCTVFPYYSVLATWLFRFLSGCRIPWILSWLEIWGRPYWNTYLGNHWKGLLGFGMEWLCARCCRNHVVISSLQAGRLQTLLGVPAEQIKVIPRGSHLDRLPVSTEKHKNLVIYAGRMAEYKNLDTLLRAWPLIVAACPDASLRLFGSGPILDKLQDLARELGLAGSVEIFPPKSSWKEIMEEIAAAEVFVQPSTREGQSVVAIEAMAMETVVVASRHAESAVSDLVVHARNGLLVERWSEPEAWSNALLDLLNDPQRLSKLALAGRQTAQRYDWETRIIPQLDALQRTVARANSHADGYQSKSDLSGLPATIGNGAGIESITI